MKKSQKFGICALAIFWILFFGIIAVFYFIYVAKLFVALSGVSVVGGIIGIVVFIYLIFFSLAMQP